MTMWLRPPVMVGLAIAIIVAGLIGYGVGHLSGPNANTMIFLPIASAAERDYFEESRANYAVVYAEYSSVRLYQESIDQAISAQRNTTQNVSALNGITSHIGDSVAAVGRSTARFTASIEAYNKSALHVDRELLKQNGLPTKLYYDKGNLVEDKIE